MSDRIFTDADFTPLGGEIGLDPGSSREKLTYWKDVWRTFTGNRVATVSLWIILILLILVLFGPMMRPFDYYSNDYSAINQAPDGVHWFGTDTLGRDLWARVWEGGRVSMLIALLATIFPELIGMLVGGISGYFGGKVDTVIMRTIDVLMGIPSLIYM